MGVFKIKQLNKTLSPVLYLAHGGGPLPLLGDKNHEGLIAFLKGIPDKIREPSAIIIISAHWEAPQATITGSKQPPIIYDYGGFPPPAYEIRYPASGNPKLSQEIVALLEKDGIAVNLDKQRGFDHGMYVPLKLMYPAAHIPCVQLSLIKNLDPSEHMALGQSLAKLRHKKVLIIGSGMSFHNLGLFFRPEIDSYDKSIEFDHWLVDTCTNKTLSTLERKNRLEAWENAPHARYCHPREEHLLPLHVCFGAASVATPAAKVVFNEDLMGARISALLWS